MAPRSQGAHHDAHGAGDHQVLHANTGAGVNPRRSTAVGGRGGSQVQQRRRPQTQAPGRAAMPRQNGRTSMPQGPIRHGNSDIFRSPQGQAPAARPTTDTVNTETSTVSTTTLAASNVTSNPTQHPPPFGGSKLTRIYPGSHRPLFPISPASHQSSFTLAPTPIRMVNTPTRTSIVEENNSPRSLPTKKRPALYRGKDVIKRAVTNPNLRAIFAGKPYPKQKRKAGAERPVLKMGISKEYK